MLIQFSVENFLSIKNTVTLSMLADTGKEHPECIITGPKKENYLKSSIIYGANASGKSNVLNALWYMIHFVLNSHEMQLNRKTGRIPFKFDQESRNKPSCFEIIFVQDGVRYDYGFSTTEDRVIDEYLYHYANGRRAVIFERFETDTYRFTADADVQEGIKERNSHNKLYLSTAANWNYKKVKPVFQWFADCEIMCRYSERNSYSQLSEQLQDIDYSRLLAGMLQVADLGIKELRVEAADAFSIQGTQPDFYNIQAVHQIINDQGLPELYTLEMPEESAGTISYLKLMPTVKKVLDSGGLLVADEMDAHLHPLLTRHVIALFNSSAYNPQNAQLIFTSHNTNLLDLDLFRRDQIWFTEKDEGTAETTLYSLDDFSVRKNARIEQGYLLGRFGAVPVVKGGIT